MCPPPAAGPPFASEHQLNWDLDNNGPLTQCLPGYPCILLQDRRKLWEFLDQEFCSKDLNQMASRLWWMSKQDSANISLLHRQLVKQRAVIVTEDPKLHLVWIHNQIFIKPLPRYIVSYAFWRDYMGDDGKDAHDIHRAALGYLRTWLYLVRYESDFRIA
ncbi:Uu.00g118230.m01.CDS01 [Anthostomella pinea]|uniref:Uu.00g118230.m01.CDS01 n=1 Tax=Anthostomella pinea TaxID=933095 RepID=A0AAI8VGB6_9PEZI|nr:Uu.00g118230.m01.CDS01 [Anthostomella pinea]